MSILPDAPGWLLRPRPTAVRNCLLPATRLGPYPRPAADLRAALTRRVPQHAVAPVPPGPAAPRQPVRVFRPEDGFAWQAAVAETVRLCLGDPPAGSDPEGALAAKLAWLKALASSGRGPLLLLAGAPAVAFLELIPVFAAHVPLPLAAEGDLFLTCIHGTPPLP